MDRWIGRWIHRWMDGWDADRVCIHTRSLAAAQTPKSLSSTGVALQGRQTGLLLQQSDVGASFDTGSGVRMGGYRFGTSIRSVSSRGRLCLDSAAPSHQLAIRGGVRSLACLVLRHGRHVVRKQLLVALRNFPGKGTCRFHSP